MQDNSISEPIEELTKTLHKAQSEKNSKLEIETLFKLSQLDYDNKNFDKSALLLKEILAIEKEHANVNYYLGLIEIEKNNYEKAILHFRKEQKINPQNKLSAQIIEKLKIQTNVPLITFLLVLANLITFYFISYPQINLTNSIKYGLSYDSFNLFNLITSLFVHINLLHFSVNMLILIMFGLVLEKKVGSINFLLIFLLSGIIGNLSQSIISPQTIVLGASAGIFGIFAAIMMLEPFFKMRLLGIFNIPIILVLAFIFLASSLLGIYFPDTFIQGEIAHLIGFFTGVLIIGILDNSTINIFYNWIFFYFGFWFLKWGLDNFVQYDFLLSGVLFLTGALSIHYSYKKLRRYYENRS